MNQTEQVNDYDYKSMLKELGATTRHEDHLRKIKRKWHNENKKYDENIEHMKEFQEENYQKKNSDLMRKLKKKEGIYLTSLENNQKTRMKERQKAIDSMMEKEKMAIENVEKFLEKQERDRLQFEKDSNEKSKYK